VSKGSRETHALLIAEFGSELALAPEQRSLGKTLRLQRMLSPQTQTNLKHAKSYFEEHLAVGDYYVEAERVVGEWIGEGAAMLDLNGVVAQRDFVALCENLIRERARG
jgi:TrwC relaxase.